MQLEKKAGEISGAQTLKSTRGNILQGKPSLGFSIQINSEAIPLRPQAPGSWRHSHPSVLSFHSRARQSQTATSSKFVQTPPAPPQVGLSSAVFKLFRLSTVSFL